jgi:hypothetical protein
MEAESLAVISNRVKRSLKLPRSLWLLAMASRIVPGRRCGGLLLWSALTLGSFSPATAAEGDGPIAIRNQFPPGLFFLYPTPEAARVLEPGRFEFETNASYSSVFNREVQGPSVLFMDFEVLRWTLKGRWGVWDRVDADVEVPFLYFSGGFLDGFINDFHKFFGLPQGDRNLVANNEFHYEVSENGKSLYHIPKAGTLAISDMVLNTRYRVHSEEEVWPGMVFKASVKFPTGSSSGGFGSGHLDYGGSLLAEKNWSRFSVYGNAGVVIPGPLSGADSAILKPQPFGVFVVAGEYRFTDWFSLILQLDQNTKPYARSPLPLLLQPATELGGGVRFKILEHGSLEVGFVDGFGSVPDFTVSSDVKWRF